MAKLGRRRLKGSQTVRTPQTRSKMFRLQLSEVLTHVFSHLPPPSLTAIALVCRRFHGLVTTPHAWRAAFSRYFPGQDTPDKAVRDADIHTDKRSFTRLTALASWRSEYILRTKLLRAVERGKPIQPPVDSTISRSPGAAQVTYSSSLISTINHLDAAWDGGPLGNRPPRFIHGADDEGAASISDPSRATLGPWGSADRRTFRCFTDELPGVPEYGMGPGDVVGVPNAMDVSQKHGMVYAEGLPGGRVFFRSADEKRGRYLPSLQVHSAPERGVVNLDASRETPCCVWIAKSEAVPALSNGLIGILAGSSYGIITTYSLGTNGLRERRLERGEVTGRWVLSPGVPIVAIRVDENYSMRRHLSERIWAVALNALGEVFHITGFPTRKETSAAAKLADTKLDELAWETGRTVEWKLVEPTERAARPDPYKAQDKKGTYSPRGSTNSMGFDAEQVAIQTREIQQCAVKPPKHFQQLCLGWSMQRRLEVDFANDNSEEAGESIFLVDCGTDEEIPAAVKRFSRVDNSDALPRQRRAGRSAFQLSGESQAGTFGSPELGQEKPKNLDKDSWLTSVYSIGDMKLPRITTTTIDKSKYAILTANEDPLLSMSASSSSSPLSTPSGDMPPLTSRSDLPGQRARFLVAGTALGSIVLWDMRAPVPSAPGIVNTVAPLATIHTDSPQISCLALTALYLIHGGNDGLVQAWDPLRSTTRPLRTLNSRFSSRARRRLMQAAAAPHGVGINLFAAGACALDPDPTRLRGVVSLGAHLKYWAFDGAGADAYRRSKRHARRSTRSGNSPGQERGVGRHAALLAEIADEELAFRQDEKAARQERMHMQKRFGVGLLGRGATDDEMLAYARMLSEEAAREDADRRQSESATGRMARSPVATTGTHEVVEEHDPEIAEAIRLSLEESSAAGTSPSVSFSGREESGTWAEVDDLELATRLSLMDATDSLPDPDRHGGPSRAGGSAAE